MFLRGWECQGAGPRCVMRSCTICSACHTYREGEFKRDKMDGACDTHMGEKRHSYNIFIGKPDGKRPLRRPRHRWDDSI